MKKFSRVLAIILSLGMTLSCALTGCGKAGDSENKSGTGGADVLKIGIVNKGYGDEFAKQLAKAFEEKTGIKTEVAKSSSADWVSNVMKSGAKNNDLDVIYDINPLAMKNVATSNFISGYDKAYVDLSDIYDEVLEGYKEGKTLEELVYSYNLKACTWGNADGDYGDGKQYFINWATGMEGILYNKALFEKYGLSVPKTTNEMFALMDTMKRLNGGTYAKNSDGYEIYPLAYSGKVNYSSIAAMVWMAQYDGIDGFNYMLEGKDANGNYSSESLKSIGKLSAMTIVSNMLSAEKKYSDPGSYGQSFTNAQVLFLAEQAFMMFSGDWIEREMEGNFAGQDLNVAFMPIPVNSDIINKCTTVDSDSKLSEVVKYLDGEGEKPSYVSDEDLAFISSARSMYCSEGNQHIAYIPAYSNNIDNAKEFLKFSLSKEGQEIMMKYAYGNMAPLNVDITQMDYYNSLSSLQKSKVELILREGGLTFVGNNYVHPMAYVGSVKTFTTPLMEAVFGVDKQSDSYMEPRKLWETQYKNMSKDWENQLKQAGVK